LTRLQHGHRVLIVDDDASMRRGYGLVLGAVGHRVVCVRSAEEALDQLGGQSFDLVLSGSRLPGLDGLSLVRLLRQREETRTLSIILVSTTGEPSVLVNGFDAGADDVLTHPVQPDELVARVETRIGQAIRFREVERRSTRDSLTGVLNRGALEEEITRELRRMARTGSPVSLVMVDINGFKSINDLHGHLVGDEALRRVATKLEASVRATDRVGRFGGDEFTLLLGDTDEQQLAELLERLVRGWRRHPPSVPLAAEPIMASFGGATAAPGGTLQALIYAADLQMYRDKRSGRR